MSAVPKPRLTLSEYLLRENAAAFKSEFYRGEIFAMAGASPRHNSVVTKLIIGLGNRLLGKPCRPFTSDQRVRIPTSGLVTYPDVAVVCGPLEMDTEDRIAINNPSVILEVLSKSTESYDRGKKFDLYRELKSLREYILVSQDEPHVERFVRQDDGTWLLTVFKGVDAVLDLPTVGCSLPLAEIYNDVTFGPEET